ncbi:MAG: hypothetical protein GEU79_06505 [Acidimicrobiia bacterium]|nr:hypothetical protein [Acidimicrobiia bacterium]
MVLWHVATALFLFRWIFQDPKVDVRFLVVGALVPDVVDLITVSVFGSFASGEIYAHSLIVPTVYLAAVLILTRRGRNRRAWVALGVGWLFHLLVDAMWTNQAIFFWPFFGWEMPTSAEPFWPAAVERAFSDPLRWILEAVGIAYLIYVWRAADLNEADTRRQLLRDGRIPR